MPLRTILNLIGSITVVRESSISIEGQSVLGILSRYERELWFLTISAMFLDVMLTVQGLQLGLRELNPIARSALDWIGVLGLYMLKAVALLIGVLCTWLVPSQFAPVVPLGLALPSLCAVLINSIVIGYVIF